MQTRTFIERLGHLEAEIVKTRKEAETVAAAVGKDNPSGVAHLKAAAKELGEKRQHVVEAREALLAFDGVAQAKRTLARHAATGRPELDERIGQFFGEVSERVASRLTEAVTRITDETAAELAHVGTTIEALRSVKKAADRTSAIKEDAERVANVLKAGEKALDKIVGMAAKKTVPEHGYDLTAGEMPDFIQKKIEERKEKGDGEKGDEKGDEKKGKKPAKGKVPPQFLEHMKGKKADHGYDLTAESRVPGNKSKGPKELDEEDMGWVPGHRTELTPEKDEGKKKAEDVTINVTVSGDDPGKIRQALVAALRPTDSRDPDPSMKEDLPGEETEGEPVVDKSAKKGESQDPGDPSMETEEEGEGEGYDPGHVEDDEKTAGTPVKPAPQLPKMHNHPFGKPCTDNCPMKKKKANDHGYRLTAPSEHGYELTG